MNEDYTAVQAVLKADAEAVLADWLAEASSGGGQGGAAATQAEAREILRGVTAGLAGGNADFTAGAWEPLRASLEALSRSRAAQGRTASETSRFVLAFKRPLFSRLQARATTDPQATMAAVWGISSLVDRMAEHTVATYQRSREDIISRQQQELLELSTPVVKLWDGILAVPMIGTLDSSRTQLVMEALLQRIVDTGSELAIIDITGVPTVDTLVAQHLLKTVTAIRLMGADCIISGIRPQIAQTIVHLGIDLQGITTKSSLADALSLAIRRAGYKLSRGAD